MNNLIPVYYIWRNTYIVYFNNDMYMIYIIFYVKFLCKCLLRSWYILSASLHSSKTPFLGFYVLKYMFIGFFCFFLNWTSSFWPFDIKIFVYCCIYISICYCTYFKTGGRNHNYSFKVEYFTFNVGQCCSALSRISFR